MVEFIRSINPGASPVANLSNRYFRPQLDDRESRALGQLANALARKRGALGGLADSYGALGGKFQQLSNAATSYQQDRLRDLQRQYDLQNKRDQLAFDQEQNQFKLAAEKQSLMLAQARSQVSDINDGINMFMSYGDSAAAIVDSDGIAPAMPRAGNGPVTSDPLAGGVTYTGPDAYGFGETFDTQLQQAASITGADITVSDATHAGNTQFAALGEQVGADTKANLSLNNPGFINWIGSADAETQRKAFDIFGDDIVSAGTGLLNLDGVTRAVPKFRSMEDGIRYMGFWAQHRGVADGTVDKAVRQWFGVNAKGPVIANGTINQETVDAYNLRMQIMADNGLQPDTPLNTREARDAFVRGTMRGEISGRNSEAILAAVPDMPLGKLFDEGQQAYQTGRLIRNNAKQYKLFNGSRDEYGPMQQGERRISLDFNAKAGKTDSFYALVVIPNRATGEERQAAASYSKGMVALMARYGYEDYGIYGSDGVATRGEIGRGKAGTFHTEPFFAQDPRAIALLENPEFMREYVQLVEGTLGQIPGAVIMAPHETGASGAEMTMANGQRISERDFALQRLMPLFGAESRSNTVNITASTQDGPLLLAGGDPNGLTVTQALAALGVPVNLGAAQDIQSVGADINGTPSLEGITLEGPDARAAEFQGGVQALTGDLRDRTQAAVDWARQQGHPNPVQAVMQSAGFRSAMKQYAEDVEKLQSAYQQQVIADYEASIENFVAEQTPSALSQLDTMSRSEFMAGVAAAGESKRDFALSLLSENEDMRAQINALFPGDDFKKAGSVYNKVLTLYGQYETAQTLEGRVLEAESAMQEVRLSGGSYSSVLDAGFDTTSVEAVVTGDIDSVNLDIERFKATKDSFSPADALELAEQLDYLRKMADDDEFLTRLNPQIATKLSKVVEAGVRLQEPIALNYSMGLLSDAETQQEVVEAYQSGLEFGEKLRLSRDVNADKNYFNEIGNAAAAQYNALQEQAISQTNGAVPSQIDNLVWNENGQRLERITQTVDVAEVQKAQATRIAGMVTQVDNLEERAGLFNYASQLGLKGVGSQVMQLAFGADTNLQTPELRDSYDQIMQAMKASQANPLQLFSETQGLNMLVLMQMDDQRRPHAILQDVQRQITSLDTRYVEYVDEVNLAGIPMTMRNNVKAALLVDVVSNMGNGAVKADVMKRFEKTLGGMVQQKSYGTLFNTGVVQSANAATSSGSTGLKIKTSNMKGEQPVAQDFASLAAASVAQHASPIIQDLNAELGPSQVKTDILAGGFNVSVSPDGIILTQGKQEQQVLELGGIPTSLTYNDRVRATLRPARVSTTVQDVETGEYRRQEQAAVFLDSEFFMDLTDVGSVQMRFIGVNGETDVRDIPVSELRSVVTSAGAAYIDTRRTERSPNVPQSNATVGYFYVLPDDVREVVPMDIDIDDISLSSGLQGNVGINRRIIQEAYDAHKANSYEVFIDG